MNVYISLMLINIKTIISIFKYLVSLGYPVHTGFMAHTRQTEIYSYLDHAVPWTQSYKKQKASV